MKRREVSYNAMETDASSEGWTTGYSTTGEDDFAFFQDDAEPLELLQGMEAEHANDASIAVQPYEMVRRARKEARQRAEELTDQESATETEGTQRRFDQELDTLAKRSRRRRKSVRKGEVSGQEDVIKQLESQAVLLFAHNRIEEGERVCREVMRMAPNSADVYQTLGSMIEQTGQHRKYHPYALLDAKSGSRALDYYMIAAHLAPRKVEFWKQLSRSSLELGFHRQAVYCLNHVLRVDKHDIDTHIDRALLYAELGENKRACDAFEKVNEMRPGDFEVVKMLGKLYHRMGHPAKAIEILEQAILRYEDQIDFTVINILTDLYLQQGSYSEASGLISRAEGMLAYGQALPIDLKVKFGICVLHMGDTDTAYTQFGDLLKEPVEDCVDLYLQSGDALVEGHEYEQALHLFERLLETPENGPALWERMTQCRELTEGKSAVVSWWLQLVDGLEWTHPHYLHAALSSIRGLADLGDLELAEERMAVLKELLESEKIAFPEDEKSMTACLLMKESLELRIGKKHNFLDEMLPIVYHTIEKMQGDHNVPESQLESPISQDVMEIQDRMKRARLAEDLNGMDAGRERSAVFAGFRTTRKEQRYARKEKSLSDTEPATQDVARLFLLEDFVKGGEQYGIFMKVVDGLVETGRLNDAEYLLTAAVQIASRVVKSDRVMRDVFRMKLVEILSRQERTAEALEAVKKLCSHWPHSIRVWNTYAMLLCRIGSSRWLTKFLSSYRQKHPGSVCVTLMMGQLLSLLGRHDAAVGEYKEALKTLPECPLIWLCLAVAKLNSAMSDFGGNERNFVVMQAFTLLQEYDYRRGNRQESWYNFGRACHQLGLKFLAVEFYNKALAVKDIDPSSDLTRVIAYNLMTLYKSADNLALARDVLKRYLTV